MKIFFTFILLIFYTISYSQLKIPKGFKELKESHANGRKVEKAVLDFDGDSINDGAMVVVNENEFSNYRFLIYLSSLKKQFEVNLNNTDFSIYPIQLKINKKTIQFGYFEDGTATFIRIIKIRYNPKLKKMQVIGYDTGYKSLPTVYIDKSYNLLTGQYIVKKTKINGDTERKISEHSGHIVFFKNKVFIEDLSAEMFEKLDEVGSEYEK